MDLRSTAVLVVIAIVTVVIVSIYSGGSGGGQAGSTILAETGSSSQDAVHYGAGFYPPERDGRGRTFRWTMTAATVLVGPSPGTRRPAVGVRIEAASFDVPRRVEVRLGTKLLGTLDVPKAGLEWFVVHVPRGVGPAALRLLSDPAAQSASTVTPGDKRLLAIAVYRALAVTGPITSAAPSSSLLSPGRGFFPPEHDAKGVEFRWQGTKATLVVAARADGSRPSTIVRASITSLLVSRQITVSLAGKKLASLTAPPKILSKVTFTVPSGRGDASLELTTSPGAQSASAVTPKDHRVLAVAWYQLAATR